MAEGRSRHVMSKRNGGEHVEISREKETTEDFKIRRDGDEHGEILGEKETSKDFKVGRDGDFRQKKGMRDTNENINHSKSPLEETGSGQSRKDSRTRRDSETSSNSANIRSNKTFLNARKDDEEEIFYESQEDFRVKEQSKEMAKALEKSTQTEEENSPISEGNIGRGQVEVFRWKMENFEKLRSDSENKVKLSLTSVPFYTDTPGYKMSLIVYPFGDYIGRGTYLSVYFVIMRGDYDDALEWPFRKIVTVSLLDQQNGSKLLSQIIRPPSNSSRFEKPTKSCNQKVGWIKYISLSSLITNSRFYKGDSICFSVQLDEFYML